MKKALFYTMTLIIPVLLLLSFPAWPVPGLINYQGKLTDPNGVSQDGFYMMEFCIYNVENVESGGIPLWNEQQNVTITNGIYNVQLGKTNALLLNLFDDDNLYLEVKIFSTSTGWETLSPRQRLTSTPFAIKAGYASTASNAETLSGLHVSDLFNAGDDYGRSGVAANLYEGTTPLTNKYVNEGQANSITNNMIVNNAITSNKIADGAVGASDLSGNAVTSAKIQDGTIQQSDLSFNVPDGHSLDAADGSPVDAVYVDSTGDVGIGTNSPVWDLDVRGTVDVTNTNDNPGDAYGILIHHKATNDVVGRRKYSLYIEQDGDFSGGDEKSSSHGINIQRVNGADQNIGLRIYQVGSSISDPLGSVSYGLRIEDVQTNGGQAYAIYVDAYDDSYLAGSLGIGTNDPKGKLDVNGEIYQRGTRIHADYVFEPKYKLESIEEHSEFMWSEKHLEAIPKAKKDKNGQDIVEYGSHIRGMLEELEKAHVYIAELNEMIKEQQKTIALLSEKVQKLENQGK